MPRYACPICGDPAAFPLWIDSEPPTECPEAIAARIDGREITITNITECRYQMRKARQRAEWMKQMPEAFDDTGAIKKEYGIVYILTHWKPSQSDEPLIKV